MTVKLIETIVNSNQNPDSIWYMPFDGYAVVFASREEITDIIAPYEEFLRNLPGCKGLVASHIGNKLIIILQFDTLQQTNDANALIYGNNKSEIVTKAQALIESYKQKNNAIYTSEVNIVE